MRSPKPSSRPATSATAVSGRTSGTTSSPRRDLRRRDVEQDRDVVGACVRGGKIRLLVSVEIRSRDERRTAAGRISLGCLEGAVAVAKENRGIRGTLIVCALARGGEICHAAPVEVCSGEGRELLRPESKATGSCKVPPPLPRK